MKRLTAILALGVILYSCTENEKPDQLNLDEKNSIMSVKAPNSHHVIQIPSQAPKGEFGNAMLMASFTPINDVSGNYTTSTTLLDISGISCNKRDVTSVTDGTQTLTFDKNMWKLQANVCEWLGTFGNPPAVEGPNPHILFSNFQNSLGISLSTKVSTFGFEMIPNLFNFSYNFQVDFYNGSNLIGSINRELINSSVDGAKLFAASTIASFDYVLISVVEDPSGFAIGQFRYSLPNDKIPFTVDVYPNECQNNVNVNSKGVIPVGILASMNLDVNDIDLSTVRLNGVVPKMSSMSDLGGFYEKEEACDCDPTELDGIMDLDLKFNTQAVVATLGDVSDGEQVTVSVTFDTVDGKSWTGEDCIWIVKKPVRR